MATQNKRVDDIESKLEPVEPQRVIVVWDEGDERLAEARARGDVIIEVNWDDEWSEPEQEA